MSSAAGPGALLSRSTGDSGAGYSNLRARVTGNSLIWLILVAGAFLLAEVTLTPLRMPLGADEITYIAQTSVHASQVILPPVHGRGAALLAAPVTLLTTSLPILRVWMALLSGLGLFLALLAWRGLRPAWMLAVAGVVIGSLAIAQVSGVMVMPDWWEALGALAVTGLFMQAVTGRMRARVVLPLLAADTFFLVLLRIQDAAFVLAPVIAVGLIVPAWRNRRVLVAIGAGIAAGAAEWIGESYAWYGGPVSRLHMMKQEPPKFALYFTLPYQLRVLSGPVYCPPGACHGWSYPWLTAWWLALLGLVVLGIFVARRMSLISSLVAVAAALSVLAAYTLFVPYAAPRYLLPVIALLTIPAADGIGWLAAAPRWRAAAVSLIAAFLLTGAVSQHFVQRNEAGVLVDAARSSYPGKASYVRGFGGHPPCVVTQVQVAYYLGCAAPWTGEHIGQLVAATPGGRKAWRKLHVPGMNFAVYVRK